MNFPDFENNNCQNQWKRFCNLLFFDQDLGLWLDISRMSLTASNLESLKGPFEKAFISMDNLEKGSIANPDENRQVGHYWLRNPHVAPSQEISDSIAKEIGFPLMVKAAAGGGGKGMRAVYKPEDLTGAIESAKNEARNSFGNDTLILERFLDKPRHIEVQILGDQKGNIIHLFERECTIQRRHQKIIEESPSAAITNKLRNKMGEAAIKAAEVTNYYSTGTVEFLYQDGEFYFLEMNTRLQVEHGVTEMVCGIDLVKWQIRVANGEELSLTQKDIKQKGHSIECRIYAEDPSRNFLPTPGFVRKLQLPVGPGIRNDVGIIEGQEVSSSYDPLLSKLVVWDSNRADAIDRMNYALGNFVVLGLITNQPFLKEIISNKDFIKGNFDTNFISENFADWKLEDIPLEAIASALLTSKSSSTTIASKDSKEISSPWNQKGHWRQGL